MRMQALEPVLILGYGTWSSDSDKDPIAWRSGKLVEKVQWREADGTICEHSLSESVNGDRVVPVGEGPGYAILTIDKGVKTTRAGNQVPKLTVVGMKPAPAKP